MGNKNNFYNMFKTIMWKNYIVRKRHWFVTLLEVTIPCLVFGVMLYIHLKTGNDNSDEPAYHPEPYNDLVECFSKNNYDNYLVAFAPNNTFTNTMMNKTREMIWSATGQEKGHTFFSVAHLLELVPLNYEYEIEHLFQKWDDNDTEGTFYGIVFDKDTTFDSDKLNYKIRVGGLLANFQTDKTFPQFMFPGRGHGGAVYKSTCFLTIQYALDKIFIETKSKQKLNYNISVSEFPYPPYSGGKLTEVLKQLLPLIIIGSFCLILPNIIKRVVEEKETGVKELMKMMGLRPWMVWVGWLLNANMVNVFVTIIISVILTVPFGSQPAIIPYTNPVIIWLMLFLFMNAVTVYLFVFCAIFHRPLIASAVGMVCYFAPQFFLNTETFQKLYSSLFTKVLVCLVPTVCVREGSNVIFAFNSRAIGIQFSNLFKSPTDDPNDISMGLVLLMFLFDTLFYAFLTWYIDCVRPGPYGRARPWYFLLNICGGRSDPKDLLLTEDDSVNNATFETPQQDLNVGISIRNLTKVFPPNVHAVNGVNIDIYKGQITALLGHNGAGKTTTMSILSGLYSPTTGTIHKHISNSKCYNVFENMSDFRQDLGLCPQHNMLFSYFTVLEHLLFFGMLKGLSIGEAKYDGKKLLQTLNISDKANVRVDSLSGGMKRKLSLAVSLIGQPKVLILDEPTSGMDPESRREMWDILLSIRQDRTIIITTHFMEEADVLGDRIAIMDHGKVQCYGTSMFLKRIYGAGYNMTLLTKPQADIQQITNIVTEAVADSKLRAHHQGQLIYNLPTEKSSKFAFLFSKIESQKSELNVTSIGVSCTTMEDVFLKVGELSVLERERRNELDRASNNSQYQFNNRGVTSSTERASLLNSEKMTDLSPKKISGLPLIVQQFCVLFVKKVRFAYRKIWGFLFFMVLSMLMLIVALHSGTLTETKVVPSFKLDLSQYPGGTVLTTYKNDPQVTSYLDYYKSVVTSAGSKITVTENGRLIDELIAEGEKNIQRFRLKMVAAAEWGVKGVTAFYTTIANHGPPISLNLITNSILKALTKNNDASIEVTNHPFSASILDPCIGGSVFNKLMVQTKWGITIPFGMLFIVASYINFPLTERLNGAKHLQLMTGLSPITYWASAYCWDIIMFMCSSFLLLIPIFFFDELRMFGSCREIGVFFFIVNMYGVSGIPFAYFFSFFKGTPAGASSAFIFYNTIFGCAGAIVMSILNALQYLTGFWYTLVNGLLMLNPYYCVSIAMLHFSALAYQSSVCRVCTDPIFQPINNCDKLKKFSYIAFADDTNTDAVGQYLVFLGIDWIIYFGIILFIDYGYMGRCFNYIKKKFVRRNAEESLDIDVQEERDRVDAVRMNVDSVSPPGQVSGLGAPVLVVDGLMKKFGLKFTAVKGISFAVSSGECFGLLGVNGAGKTTTFKMLTGDEIPTAGTAKILKYSLTADRAKYLKQIGYCPQFDAINEMMTGMEMLDIFGKLRGLTPGETQHQADYWIDLLGLDEYKDRLCGTYSGGNKRKLSTAMSLIGDPVIVFLDEPTSGVDPVARRRLWNVLAKCQKGGQSIVLTSHSMDECEALCNRLTIMVKGQMVCIGNIQYLKQRFGQGFTIMVKIRSVEHPEEHLDELKRHIEQKFAPGCILKDEHKGLLHYHVTDTTKPWSLLFQSMDDIKKQFELVEDYVVSETTLEQVFISFAKQQKED